MGVSDSFGFEREVVDEPQRCRAEGLANAVLVLTKVLEQCYAGDTVIRKFKRRTRAPGPPKPRKVKPAQTGTVVSLVRPPVA